MNIQKIIAVVAVFLALAVTYELISTSRATATTGTITKIDYPVKSVSSGNFQFNFFTDVPKVEISFSHNGRTESFRTAYSPRNNRGSFYTVKTGLEVQLVYFNNKPRTVTLEHYYRDTRFKLFVLLPFLLVVAVLGFLGLLKKTSDSI